MALWWQPLASMMLCFGQVDRLLRWLADRMLGTSNSNRMQLKM